ncbi:MAG: response regulator, partial [Gammaproteobacteria bacterium]
MIEENQYQREKRVLIVDDDEQIRRVLTRILEGAGYRCEVAASSAEGRAKLAEDTFALMLCDIHMPGGSGLDLVDEVRCGPSEIATLVVSGEDSEEVGAQVLALGVYGYVVKPFKRSELLINVTNAFRRQHLEDENRELRRSTEEIRQSGEQTIRRLSRAAEYRDPETGGHLERMSRYCELLASRLDLNPHTILVASPMHDVGKAALPDGVVLKPGSLNREERRIMERHAEAGHDILSGTASELLEVAAEIAWTHHEKFDGTGYPRG